MAFKIERTDTAIRGRLEPGRYSAGDGLYLQVRPAKPDEDGTPRVSKNWIFRFRCGVDPNTGKPVEREMGLGSFPDVGLKDARKKAAGCRAMRDSNVDPLAERDAKREREAREAARAMTFRQCGEALISLKEGAKSAKAELTWGNAKHRQQWRNTLATYVYPLIGNVPVSAIGTPHVVKVLDQPVLVTDRTGKQVTARFWDARPETASRVRGRMEAILDFAKAREYRTGENPARYRGHLAVAGFELKKRVDEHASLPYAQIAELVRELQGKQGMAALALQFLILTAARTGEVLGARWSEIDVTKNIWTVPAERMKAGREHRVPMSAAAVAVLEKVKGLNLAFVFPGARSNRPLSNMAMLELLRGMNKSDQSGRIVTAHGFRSTFRTWTAECTSFPREVAEMALAHTIESKVEAAYQRGDMLERRRELMNAWASFCVPKHQRRALHSAA